MKHNLGLAIILIGSLMTMNNCDQHTSEFESFINEFIESSFELEPTFGIYMGRHEYDGQLPDWSKAGIDKRIRKLKEAKAKTNGFADEYLDDAQKFDKQYILAVIDEQLFALDEARLPFTNPSYYTWAMGPDVYLSREYAPLEERMKAYTIYAGNIPAAVDQIKENMDTPMPKTFAELGMRSAKGMATYFRDDVPGIFASVEEGALQEAFVAANESAAAGMESLGAWYEKQIASATDDYALGEELYRKMLWMNERVNTPLDELEKIAYADLERNTEDLKKACEEFAPGKSVFDCVALAQEDKPEGGAVEGARAQLSGLKQFLIEKDLVTIPGTEEALVDEAPPHNRWNFAYIEIPGPYEENLPSVYYIAPPDPTWPEEDQLNFIPGKADLMFTSVHEVWPGHFLHFLHANRVKRMMGRVFQGYAYTEGWAHYTEELMIEAGLGNGDPVYRIGQILNATLRNVRFISSLKLHTQGMSVEESKTMFKELGFQDSGNAIQQAARGTFDPGYLNYNIGKLMIQKLRTDWCADKGGEKAWKEFHDAYLSYGGPPIPLVRKHMLGDKDDGKLF
ncbi:MAG: DUF885 domain-containing protein [Candidatus Marinimicrobia bacterium]|nr:DUF885 domain-containing protein [Candidatus Neomarinimicrobiota bacterium]MDP6790007.1 DUF885 domain-containing protein [Candidatus Neomarinimicrobiota bacterium]MDP7072108.1 DUF885 domain-containing protein [Candidatus Neomarinimicrobiota bacterium]